MGSYVNSAWEEVDEWTVHELTAYIKELFELDYRLQDVQVAGEISNFTRASSGHLYFTLKDEKAQLSCVMWRSNAARLGMLPADGDAVIARGNISVYEQSGRYQLYARTLQPAGRGDLAAAFERLKQKLEAEGLFDAAHKQEIPPFPRRIGVVTSADAAALRDILNVLQRRCAFVSVLVAPTLVQGAGAPSQIVRALRWLDGRDDIDTIILARGGGSIEDLWAFNDEEVARAIFNARHPIVCGVGHETDFTIADFVADKRAPTPSAAAELSVPDIGELQPRVEQLFAALYRHLVTRIEEGRWQVQSLMRDLKHVGPRGALINNWQRVDHLSMELDQAISRRLERAQNRTALATARLRTVSPLATLSRGYAIVRREDGDIVRSTAQVMAGDALRVQVSDGKFVVTVDEV
ncbi:MAG TPA: exodeoxyribonuclease VII large subunit [Candidatus Sulfomarinibacteraceae bacterium]|nr:exodeoxyribonuclease VII large subunit [Candidatus Sulfomarinibacteraceae bacterium]